MSDIYRLHIDAVPPRGSGKVKKPALHASSKKPLHTVVPTGHHASTAAAPTLWARIWDKLEFVLVSALVFAIIYVVLNWQALVLNARYYWDNWRGVANPLERLIAREPPASEKLLPLGPGASSVIPPLDIEIMPTDMRVVIPRIRQNVPVIGVANENLIARRWEDLEADIQQALRSGVVHYPGTALPGDNGNVVITGHSSYYAWDPGRFKDVFALLHDVRLNDKVVVYFNQRKFIYEVENIKVVLPKDVDVLGPTSREQLTLITCTPIGTNLKRLILTAKLVEQS